MSVALPIIPNRRGACPTLHEPMPTGDGLLARLRLAGGRLSPSQLAGLATLAANHGNGLLEITLRGNLQVRGLRPDSAGPFALAAETLVATQSGLVVETPPLAGDDPREIADPRALAAAIHDDCGFMADRLGPKFTIVVDGQGQITLDELKADIRVTAMSNGHWQVDAGQQQSRTVPAHAVVAAVQDYLGRQALSSPGPRRTIGTRRPVSPLGTFALKSTRASGVALPFGGSDHTTLIALADAAATHGVTDLRLAPYHGLLAIGPGAAFTAAAAQLGLITDPADPRIRVSACIGSMGCASGYIPARADAARLAKHLPFGTDLHVSGCAKGCAHPRPAGLTLVGRGDGYGLVIDGTAGDTPQAVLRGDEIESVLAARQG
ncbi:precorrin-3B synthase [uncultured Devosia sp.]|uniref:precorrin-3B synthase n=1 Tax=uncultured Devosia sp. TaxID=211434 RepID=UPI0035CAAC45